MAEWLRREIRNLLGSPRAGSNPVRSVHFDSFFPDPLNTDKIATRCNYLRLYSLTMSVIQVKTKYARCEQDSNLRGETPRDF